MGGAAGPPLAADPLGSLALLPLLTALAARLFDLALASRGMALGGSDHPLTGVGAAAAASAADRKGGGGGFGLTGSTTGSGRCAMTTGAGRMFAGGTFGGGGGIPGASSVMTNAGGALGANPSHKAASGADPAA